MKSWSACNLSERVTGGMPSDKLKAPSKAEGLRVDTERRFLP